MAKINDRPYCHHSMARVVPDDHIDLLHWNGECYGSDILVTGHGGWVRALPCANPEGHDIRLEIASGGYFPCKVRRVYETGTTATGLYAIWEERRI